MKVLVPIDGSLYSKKAVDFLTKVKSLKQHTKAIYLLNVQKKLPEMAREKLKTGVIGGLYDLEFRSVIKPAKKKLEDAGYKVKVRLAYGKATDKIIDTAKDMKASLIVMGSHGHTPVKGLLLGSKTSAVLASCDLPMLVIREKSEVLEGRHQAGICIDGSEYSEAAVDYVKNHLPLFGKDPVFHLINVIPSIDPAMAGDTSATGSNMYSQDQVAQSDRSSINEKIEPLYEELRGKDIEARIVLLKGDVATEIAKYAKDHNLTLLILGTHGHGQFKAMMMGSVSMKISAQSDLPILFIHKEESKGKKEEETEEDTPIADPDEIEIEEEVFADEAYEEAEPPEEPGQEASAEAEQPREEAEATQPAEEKKQ